MKQVGFKSCLKHDSVGSVLIKSAKSFQSLGASYEKVLLK